MILGMHYGLYPNALEVLACMNDIYLILNTPKKVMHPTTMNRCSTHFILKIRTTYALYAPVTLKNISASHNFAKASN
jgi:hypothetical protein